MVMPKNCEIGQLLAVIRSSKRLNTVGTSSKATPNKDTLVSEKANSYDKLTTATEVLLLAEIRLEIFRCLIRTTH